MCQHRWVSHNNETKAREKRWLLVNGGFLGIAIAKASMHRNGALVVLRLDNE